MNNKKRARILFVSVWSLLTLLAIPLRYVTGAIWAPALFCGFSTPMLSIYLFLGSKYIFDPFLFGEILYILFGAGVGVCWILFGILALLGKKNYFPHLILADIAASVVEALAFAIRYSSFSLGLAMIWPLLVKLALVLLVFFYLCKKGKTAPPSKEIL